MSKGSEPSPRAQAEIRIDEMYAEVGKRERQADTIKSTYVLTVHTSTGSGPGYGQLRKEFLQETAENITDLLPAGWWVEIHEWDNEKE